MFHRALNMFLTNSSLWWMSQTWNERCWSFISIIHCQWNETEIFQITFQKSCHRSCGKATKNKILKIRRYTIYHFIAHWRTRCKTNKGVLFRSSRSEVFCKKVFLKFLQNSQGNTCARVSFYIKLQASCLQLY